MTGTDDGRAAIFCGLCAAMLRYGLCWVRLSHVREYVVDMERLDTLIIGALFQVCLRAWLVLSGRVGKSWEPLWVTVDLLVITGVVRLTGRVNSEAALIYFWPIATYSILRRPRGAAPVGAASGLLYVAATGPEAAMPDYRERAQASTASVELSFSDEGLRCVVADDGVGCDLATVPAEPTEDGGIGMTSMRERAASVGGTLTVDSAPGRGTRILFSVPSGAAGV